MFENSRCWFYGSEWYDFEHDIWVDPQTNTLSFLMGGGQHTTLRMKATYWVNKISESQGLLNMIYEPVGMVGPRLEPFQRKKLKVPFKIEKGGYIFTGPWNQMLVYDRKLTFEFSPFPLKTPCADKYTRMDAGVKYHRRHEDWLVFYGKSNRKCWIMEKRLTNDRKPLYDAMCAKEKQLEQANGRFWNPLRNSDLMKRSHCITLHKHRLFEEFKDA